jgi:hypothetical protein
VVIGRGHKGDLGVIGAVAAFSLLILLAFGAASGGAQGGQNEDSASGSGTNEFLVVLGEAHLSGAAHSGPGGEDPTGHIRAQGDPDGVGPMEPFQLEGEVTCLRVSDNRAAIKYRFKHATGSAAPFAGGGVEIFLEDNGDPSDGQAVDRTTFDPPQSAATYDLAATQCDDPDSRFSYDQLDSGNFGVHDATP